MQTANDLYPETHSREFTYGWMGINEEDYKPIPWLRIIAGLSMMGNFRAKYRRRGEQVEIAIFFATPSTEAYDGDGKPFHANPAVRPLHLTRAYRLEDLALCEDPRLPVMNQIRQVAEHELLESLQVIGAGGKREPFWKREVDGLHGRSDIRAELIDTRLQGDAVLCSRQKNGSSDHASMPIKQPTSSKAQRAQAAFNPFADIANAARNSRFSATLFAEAFASFRPNYDRQDPFRGSDFFRRRADQESERKKLIDVVDHFRSLGNTVFILDDIPRVPKAPVAEPLDLVHRPTPEETARFVCVTTKPRATLPCLERPSIIPIFPEDMFKHLTIRELIDEAANDRKDLWERKQTKVWLEQRHRALP